MHVGVEGIAFDVRGVTFVLLLVGVVGRVAFTFAFPFPVLSRL